jgi:glycosyltransferase involved in cell wall biosynthesis
VVPIRHAENGGAGAATKTGYRRALADGVDVVVVVNGDGQMDTGIMDRFLDPIVEGRADFAKGTRLSTPAHREPMSRWRLFGNALLTGMTRVATGYWGLSDTQNGYTAISRHTLAKLDLDSLYDRHGFLNDLIAHLSAVDARIADVPHPAVYGDEESSIRYGQFVPGLSALLARHFIGRVRRRLGSLLFWPAAVGYASGALSFVLALLQTVELAVGIPGPSPSTVALSALAGCLALAFGVGWDAAAGRIRDGGGRVRVERGDPA